MIELISTKYYVCRFADGFFDGIDTFSTRSNFVLYLTAHSIEGGRWEKDEKTKFLFDNPVDAYAAALQAQNQFDLYGNKRQWFFLKNFIIKKTETFKTVKETVISNELLGDQYAASVKDTIEENKNLNDSFIKITTKGGNDDDFVKILKKADAAPLKVATTFDPKTVIEEAKRMAALAGFDGNISEDMLDEQ